MRKLSLLVFAGFVLAASSYQMLVADTMADADRTVERHALEITTRNAAIGAFTEARHLIEDAGSAEPFAPPGMRLAGQYKDAIYRTHIVADGETIFIHSAASLSNGVDAADFSISAEVAWTSPPIVGVGVPAKPYLVLKAYRER